MTGGGMSLPFWHLPGPRRYLDGLVRDLEDGKNVLIGLPDHAPLGLVQMLRSVIGDLGLSWRILDVSEDAGGGAPARLLFDRFRPDLPAALPRSVGVLVREATFWGHLLWIDGITAASWPEWLAFLLEYSHACRTLPLHQRTLFCVPLFGALAANLPAEQLCLTRRCFRGFLEQLDLHLYAATLASERTPLRRQLQATLAAEVALWDVSLVERLCQEPLERSMLVREILAEVAQERAWDRARCAAPTWHAGMVGVVDGVESVNAAVLAVNGDRRGELDRRLWSAQVRVLLPFVEARRRELLDRVPMRPELRRLEVGQLAGMCIDVFPAAVRPYVRLLRDVRNALSHLQTVTLSVVAALEQEIPRARAG